MDEHGLKPEELRLGDRVVAQGLAPRSAVEELAAEARATGRRIAETLIRLGPFSEGDVYRLLAEQHHLPFAEASSLIAQLDGTLSRQVPLPYLEHAHLVPILRRGQAVVVATSEPGLEAPELLRALQAQALELQLVTPTDLRRLLNWLERDPAPAWVRPPRGGDLSDVDPRSEPQLIGLFDALVLEAVGERASDLHLERGPDSVQIRLRVDGDLRPLPRFAPSHEQLDGLINVLKVRARLDIAQHQVPQGGRIQTSVAGRTYDLRVQIQPTYHGETAVVRLLQQVPEHMDFEGLGLAPEQANLLRRHLASPQGLVMVVGPTGSGKSTTLYCGLVPLARDSRLKVITIEDPVEYLIPGAQQTSARPEAGFGFADAMRAFVRQDPDVIMVGEVRDPETALEATRASQTGHLVLTTLHCSDTVDALTRLRTLGVDTEAVAAELQLVIAQRLAQRLCTACREEVAPAPAVVAEVFGSKPPGGLRAFRGAGCPACGGTGIHGRVGIFEVLPFRAELRAAVAAGAPLEAFRQLAWSGSFKPLRESMLELAQRGVIAFHSIPELLPLDRLLPSTPR